jgi:sulfoxide reductase heme-binding subunit YedZ
MDANFIRLVVFINSLVPLAMLGWDAARGQLGANPLEFAIRTTGVLALVFLLLSLAVTPLRKALGIAWMIKLRRMLGLFGFFYGLLHLLTYMWFDKIFNLAAVIEDVGKRPFITVGMASFILLVPLAVTSTTGMIKRLGGKRWSRLHRLAYVAAAGGVIHFYMLVKADTREPLLFALALAILLGYRVVNRFFPEWTQRPARRTVRSPRSEVRSQ